MGADKLYKTVAKTDRFARVGETPDLDREVAVICGVFPVYYMQCFMAKLLSFWRQSIMEMMRRGRVWT